MLKQLLSAVRVTVKDELEMLSTDSLKFEID